jgi:tetratricopeptide (TPR) repeat protein
LPAGSRDELLDEAEYVRTSLADLDRERAAGELAGSDYEALRVRYEERAEAIERALAEAGSGEGSAPAVHDGGSGSAGTRPSAAEAAGAPSRRAAEGAGAARRPGAKGWLSTRRHRIVLGWSAAACFAVAATLVGLSLGGVAPFASSEPATLTVSDQIRIELAEAGVLASNKNLVQAITVYDRVLELDPEQPEALADGGWLARLAGLSSKSRQVIVGADAEIATAVQVAPGYALARAYDGVALFEDDHSAGGAVVQFRALLADKPSPTLVKSVATTAEKAFHGAGVAVPAAFAAVPAKAG